MRLKNMTTIHSGVPFSSRPDLSRGKDCVRIIQMRDLGRSSELRDSRSIVSVKMEPRHKHYFIEQGDLIFRSRGKTTTTKLVKHSIPRTIFSAPLLRIRVHDKRVLPEYICWFMNTTLAQAFFHSRATGTAMVIINKSAIEDLEVPLPPIETQRKVAEFANLHEKEQDLMKQVADLKDKICHHTLMSLVKKIDNIYKPKDGLNELPN